MSFLRNRLLRRFSIVGRLADVALVGSMALRVAQRKGWIDSKKVDQYGLDDIDEQPAGITEMVLAGAAIMRLLRRRKR